MKRFTSTLLTISAILISSTSIVSAQYAPTYNDHTSGTVQDSSQESYLTGDSNMTRQDSRQMRTEYDEEDGTTNGGTTRVSMQQSRQLCDAYGTRLDCGQYNQQEHHSDRRRHSMQ